MFSVMQCTVTIQRSPLRFHLLMSKNPSPVLPQTFVRQSATRLKLVSGDQILEKPILQIRETDSAEFRETDSVASGPKHILQIRDINRFCR